MVGVAAATLSPMASETISGFCIVCGPRGLADWILNLALYIPFGVLARRLGARYSTVVLAGLSITIGIESLQFFIAGRDASIGDIVSNTMGGAIGGLLASAIPTLVRPDRGQASRLSIGAALVLSGSVWLLAALLEPRFPSSEATLHFPPEADWLGGEYEGEVRTFVIADSEFDPTRDVQLESDAVTAIREGREIYTLLTPARPAPGFRPFVGIRNGASGRWTWRLGGTGRDLTLRLDRAAQSLRLTQADLRFREALALPSGTETFSVRVWQDGNGLCIARDESQRCGLGFTAGSGWVLLWPGAWTPYGAERWLDVVWLALCTLPFGFWWRRSTGHLAAVGLWAVTVLGLPVVSSLMVEWAVAASGLSIGFAGGMLLRRRGGWRIKAGSVDRRGGRK